jgi:hypothetical protein
VLDSPVSTTTPLLVATLLCGGRLAWVAPRDRTLDPFALFMPVLFGTGLALSFVASDARLLLVKDVATSALAGLLFLGSCVVGRPMTFYAAMRFAGPGHAERIRAGWVYPQARRAFTHMTGARRAARGPAGGRRVRGRHRAAPVRRDRA